MNRKIIRGLEYEEASRAPSSPVTYLEPTRATPFTGKFWLEMRALSSLWRLVSRRVTMVVRLMAVGSGIACVSFVARTVMED